MMKPSWQSIGPQQSKIKNGSWTDIVVGTNVEVEGVVVIEEGVRIIQAEKIELQEDALLELEGLVSNYNDDHFTIKGAKVFITENTVFKHGQRQSLANGVEVEVKARPLGDKLVAIEIEFEDQQRFYLGPRTEALVVTGKSLTMAC